MNDKFISNDNTFTFPICNKCKHYYRNNKGATCTAFLSGIPDAILTGEFNHEKPYKGDNGIQFKLVKESLK